jgi:hypothetical protein
MRYPSGDRKPAELVKLIRLYNLIANSILTTLDLRINHATTDTLPPRQYWGRVAVTHDEAGNQCPDFPQSARSKVSEHMINWTEDDWWPYEKGKDGKCEDIARQAAMRTRPIAALVALVAGR